MTILKVSQVFSDENGALRNESIELKFDEETLRRRKQRIEKFAPSQKGGDIVTNPGKNDEGPALSGN